MISFLRRDYFTREAYISGKGGLPMPDALLPP
jgi:hypothetical protein